jgi:hypothetical protein
MPLSEQDHKDRIGKDHKYRASYGVGSTTQGGSNFGQGSAALGADSAKQGSEAGKGSNYDTEKGKLGDSSTGTSNEGSSSPDAGAADSGQSDAVKENSRKGEPGWSGDEERNDTRRKQDITPDAESKPKEGDRKDIAVEHRPGFDVRFRQTFRPDSRGWSRSSMEEN